MQMRKLIVELCIINLNAAEKFLKGNDGSGDVGGGGSIEINNE